MIPIKILIVDDEALARKRIHNLLSARDYNYEIMQASNSCAAKQLCEAHNPDIVFLDIRMPETDGFALLDALGESKPKVIFQTAYQEYAVRAFEVQASNYLLKPFTAERFYQALDLATNEICQTKAPSYKNQFIISAGRQERAIVAEDVLYFTSRDHSTYICLIDRSYSFDCSLKQLEDELDPEIFIRIHRNTIINLNHVASWSLTYPMLVTMTNDQILQVSKEKRKHVREQFRRTN